MGMEQKYLGITPYDEDGSFVFVGRSDETRSLYNRIIRNDYTVYYAASGEGKSSLIRAGLLPILRRRGFFPVYIVFEDKEFNKSSFEDIIKSRIKEEANKHNVRYEQSSWSLNRFNQEASAALENNLWWKLRNYCFKRGELELQPLFIFDQFEEVFTKADYEWTDSFFSWLEEISTDYLPESLHALVKELNIDVPTQKNYKALFSFRTEYLGDLDYWCVEKHFLPSMQENRICLKPLTPKGAREVITLNEESLGIYADQIIIGCADSKIKTINENQPCVYALILSVVCRTLSELPEGDRDSLLNNLRSDQDGTINDILLRFYKERLKAIGLDYVRDEKIIESIENALVDEKGKRSRRDTDENSMQPIAKWVELMSDKDVSLIKVIGRKEVEGEAVKTVEFPHDRLCQAIDSSRKERQRKIAWKLKRRGEWMQFGIITAVFLVIAYLWTLIMPFLKPLMHSFLSSNQGIATKIISISNNIEFGESFSAVLLLAFLVLLIPLMTASVTRKNKKWQRISLCLSSLGVLSFGGICFLNRGIEFESLFLPIITVIALVASIVVLFVSSFNLKTIRVKGEVVSNENFSTWPLWGGCFLFAVFAFNDFLTRTTFGTSEPKDSSWALILFPLLFLGWASGFFCLRSTHKKLFVVCKVAILFILLVLSLMSWVSNYNEFKQTYGFSICIALIVMWILLSTVLFWQADSNSEFFKYSFRKRIAVIILGIIVLVVTFILNLGYNPIAIKPSSVCHVSSWRSVIVRNLDSKATQKLGIVCSVNGKAIIPCCVSVDSAITKSLLESKYPFVDGGVPIQYTFINSPFADENKSSNMDSSLVWDYKNSIVKGVIPCAPTLEEYLQKTRSKQIDSIDYYASLLFTELREANINYLITGNSYDIKSLPSFEKLDSLQINALEKELLKNNVNAPNNTIRVLEDKLLVDLYKEITRCFLLCLIKDRINQQDMPAMFSLATTYLLVYFTSVPAMSMKFKLKYTNNVLEDSVNIFHREGHYTIDSDDILERKLFAWHDLFKSMCLMDIGWNNESINNTRLLSILNEIITDLNQRHNISTMSISPDMDLKQLVQEIDRYTKLLYNTDYYKSIKLKVDSAKEYTGEVIEGDSAIIYLKNRICCGLYPILNNHPNGIYNNSFEGIIRDLILVQAFRGYDITQDANTFSTYINHKYSFFDAVKQNNYYDKMASARKELNTADSLLNQLIKSCN